MIPQAVLQFVHFCKEVGLTQIVVSPGSRSAPLVLALNRIGGITLHTAMDERSGAFLALGMAISINKPVAILCTSGTALLNYGPAVAEAFYQQIPLFVLSADRPPESIDQLDGQAIRQLGILESHTKFWANMPSLDETESAQKHARFLINKAFFEANSFPKGPVHLNFPFREPLYPSGSVDFNWPKGSISIHAPKSALKLDPSIFHRLSELFLAHPRRLVLVGQTPWNENLKNSLLALSQYGQVVVAGDCLNNLAEAGLQSRLLDWYPDSFFEDESCPEILITLGLGQLSKKIKNFIKKNSPKHHWHICESGFPADPLGTLTEVVNCDPHWFLAQLAETAFFQFEDKKEKAQSFQQRWISKEIDVERKLNQVIEEQPWSDFYAVYSVLDKIPSQSSLFAGNSMAIRYVNVWSSRLDPTVWFFANRGTSGIDGCVSTSLGIARANPMRNMFAIVGDMSFFYDRNGLWGQVIPPNFKIVVLNNAGGNIFRILPGSGKVPELEALFEMNQPLSARGTAIEAGMGYFSLNCSSDAESVIQSWLSHSGSALLECFTDKISNEIVYSNLKLASYESRP